ncbi:hypothetical protein BH09BAC1_BH09BAC1_18220 [soil metagenome]
MKKKIYINRPEMSSGHIAAHKNFGALQQGFQPPSGGGASSGIFSKTVYLATGLIVVTLSLTIWYFTGNNDAKELATETIIQTTEILGVDTTRTNDASVVVAPLSGIDIPYSYYKLQAEQGKTLTYPTGTRIIVPSNAFVNQVGQVVTGEIEVRYREFHDPVAFFVAGIPMEYDSAKVNYHFESAGMMEIAAYQNGERLYTNPDAPITMEMRSYNASAAYNIYSLNEGTGVWSLKGKDVISGGDASTETQPDGTAAAAWDGPPTVIPTLQSELKQIQKEIVKIKQTEPTKPVKANPDRNRFDVDVVAEEFPEIAAYKGVFFEVSDLNKEFKEEWYTQTWEDVLLRRLPDSLNYEAIFTKKNQVVKIIVYPVLEGKNYADAKKLFDQKYATYQTKLKQRQEEEKRKQEEIAAQQKQYEKESIARNTEADVVRTFQIDQFGFWNSDSPQMMPMGALVAAQFVDEDGKALLFYQLYLVEYGRNAIFKYYEKTLSRFAYNPKIENLVWGMTSNGNLAIIKPKQLHGLYKQNEKVKFEMQVITQLPESLDELKQLLGYKGNLPS